MGEVMHRFKNLLAVVQSMVRQIQLADVAQRLRPNGLALDMTPAAARRLGIAIHELATKAAKHGAFLGMKGRVSVTWQISGDDSMLLHLSWQDHSAGGSVRSC